MLGIEDNTITFYHGKGCNDCNNTGYSGRKGIFELLRMNSKIRELITEKAPSEVISKAGSEDHVSMLDSGIAMIKKGITSAEEVLRVAKSISEDE